jgi:hypothetical protein
VYNRLSAGFDDCGRGVTEASAHVNHLAMGDLVLVQISISGKRFCPETATAWRKVIPDVR